MSCETPTTMRALVFNPPGDVEKLDYVSASPAPQANQLKPGEVLIKVVAAGLIHPELYWPVHQAKNGTWPSRILCPDYAGRIHALGPDVTEFALGDAVMAVSSDLDEVTGIRKFQGGAAEFAVAPVGSVMAAPANVSLRDAASIPLCAFTAWQAFHEQAEGRTISGSEVLIAGAGGATGLWAVQVAKYMGARVTVTASDAKGIALLRNLGADEVINYHTEKVEDGGRRFDFVLDAVGGKTFQQCAKVVKPVSENGLLISLVVYGAANEVPDDVAAKFFIWRPAKDQMEEIKKLIEGGQLEPIVDSCFPLDRGVEAYTYAAKGHCHGKVILEI